MDIITIKPAIPLSCVTIVVYTIKKLIYYLLALYYVNFYITPESQLTKNKTYIVYIDSLSLSFDMSSTLR